MEILGIDIGGSGIKGAVVDTGTGELLTDRLRLKTPQPATPESVAGVVARIVDQFRWKNLIGCGFPAPIKKGVAVTATNIDPSWIGVKLDDVFRKATGCSVHLVNDADAAGVAEMKFGAGKGVAGVVVLITIGTGLGSALFVDGKLVPNTELGQLELRGKNAELRASDRIRKQKNWKWKKWAAHVDEYLKAVESVVRPDLIILGGGVSKKAERILPHLTLATPVVPALLQNEAGIIGAAVCAS